MDEVYTWPHPNRPPVRAVSRDDYERLYQQRFEPVRYAVGSREELIARAVLSALAHPNTNVCYLVESATILRHQVAQHLAELLGHMGLGKYSPAGQVAELRNGSHIMVVTPEQAIRLCGVDLTDTFVDGPYRLHGDAPLHQLLQSRARGRRIGVANSRYQYVWERHENR